MQALKVWLLKWILKSLPLTKELVVDILINIVEDTANKVDAKLLSEITRRLNEKA